MEVTVIELEWTTTTVPILTHFVKDAISLHHHAVDSCTLRTETASTESKDGRTRSTSLPRLYCAIYHGVDAHLLNRHEAPAAIAAVSG